MDLKLPGDSGLSAVTALKARLPGIRILVLTGYATVDTAIQEVLSGLDLNELPPDPPKPMPMKLRLNLRKP